MPNPSPQYFTVIKDEVYKTVHPIDLNAYLNDGWILADSKETLGVVRTTSNYQVAIDEPMEVAFSPSLTGGALTPENGVPVELGTPANEAQPVPESATLIAAGESITPPQDPAPPAPTPVILVEPVETKPARTRHKSEPKE